MKKSSKSANLNPFNDILSLNNKSKLELSNENKLQVVLNKYNHYWNGMIEWETQAFNTSKWYSSIVLALMGFLVSQDSELTIKFKIIISILLAIFGISTLTYLLVCKSGFYQNYYMSVYSEEVLRLFDKDYYIAGKGFLPGEFRKVSKVKKLTILVVFHVLMILFSTAGTLIL